MNYNNPYSHQATLNHQQPNSIQHQCYLSQPDITGHNGLQSQPQGFYVQNARYHDGSGFSRQHQAPNTSSWAYPPQEHDNSFMSQQNLAFGPRVSNQPSAIGPQDLSSQSQFQDHQNYPMSQLNLDYTPYNTVPQSQGSGKFPARKHFLSWTIR